MARSWKTEGCRPPVPRGNGFPGVRGPALWKIWVWWKILDLMENKRSGGESRDLVENNGAGGKRRVRWKTRGLSAKQGCPGGKYRF